MRNYQHMKTIRPGCGNDVARWRSAWSRRPRRNRPRTAPGALLDATRRLRSRDRPAAPGPSARV